MSPLRRYFARVLACLGQPSGGDRIASVLQAGFPRCLFLILLAPLLLATLVILLAPLAVWHAAAGLPWLLRRAPATRPDLLGARLFLASLTLMLAAAWPPGAHPLLLAVACLLLAAVTAGACSRAPG